MGRHAAWQTAAARVAPRRREGGGLLLVGDAAVEPGSVSAGCVEIPASPSSPPR